MGELSVEPNLLVLRWREKNGKKLKKFAILLDRAKKSGKSARRNEEETATREIETGFCRSGPPVSPHSTHSKRCANVPVLGFGLDELLEAGPFFWIDRCPHFVSIRTRQHMYHPLPVLSPSTQSWQATRNLQKLFGLAGTDETGRRADSPGSVWFCRTKIASLAANDKKTISNPGMIVIRKVLRRGSPQGMPSRKC